MRQMMLAAAVALMPAAGSAAVLTYTYQGQPMPCHSHSAEDCWHGPSVPAYTGSFTIDEALVPGGTLANAIIDVSQYELEAPFGNQYLRFGNYRSQSQFECSQDGCTGLRLDFITDRGIARSFIPTSYPGEANRDFYLRFGPSKEIVEWDLALHVNGGCGDYMETISSFASDCGVGPDTYYEDQAHYWSDAPGTWTVTPAPIPLPAPFFMLGSVVLAAAGWKLRRA